MGTRPLFLCIPPMWALLDSFQIYPNLLETDQILLRWARGEAGGECQAAAPQPLKPRRSIAASVCLSVCASCWGGA